jgi:hypothetical protein
MVPDLSGQVVRIRADAVFVGNYSLIFIGKWGSRTVSLHQITFSLSVSLTSITGSH